MRHTKFTCMSLALLLALSVNAYAAEADGSTVPETESVVVEAGTPEYQEPASAQSENTVSDTDAAEHDIADTSTPETDNNKAEDIAPARETNTTEVQDDTDMDTSEPTDISEPVDTSEPADTSEPVDTSEPIDTSEPVETSEPADTSDENANVDESEPNTGTTPEDKLPSLDDLVKIAVPDEIGSLRLNPYGLDVNLGDKTVTDQIISPVYTLKNESPVPVEVTVSVTGVTAPSAEVSFADNKGATEGKTAFLYLEMMAADKESKWNRGFSPDCQNQVAVGASTVQKSVITLSGVFQKALKIVDREEKAKKALWDIAWKIQVFNFLRANY